MKGTTRDDSQLAMDCQPNLWNDSRTQSHDKKKNKQTSDTSTCPHHFGFSVT